MLARLKTEPPPEGATIEIPKLEPDTVVVSGTGAFVATDLLRELNEQGIKPGELMTVIKAVEAQEGEAGHMVSLVKKRTGIDNTLFASTKGHSRHAARIKIAINPPDSLNEISEGTSMALHDFGTVGAYAPSWLLEQVRQFIELNRDVLLEYWDAKIDTGELLDRLKPIPPKK